MLNSVGAKLSQYKLVMPKVLGIISLADSAIREIRSEKE